MDPELGSPNDRAVVTRDRRCASHGAFSGSGKEGCKSNFEITRSSDLLVALTLFFWWKSENYRESDKTVVQGFGEDPNIL